VWLARRHHIALSSPRPQHHAHVALVDELKLGIAMTAPGESCRGSGHAGMCPNDPLLKSISHCSKANAMIDDGEYLACFNVVGGARFISRTSFGSFGEAGGSATHHRRRVTNVNSEIGARHCCGGRVTMNFWRCCHGRISARSSAAPGHAPSADILA
jgi:hypothetical protein